MQGNVVVIGLDGATFEVIDPMIAQGELPNLAQLQQQGSYGILHSCIPDLSPPAWTSFMTGTHPGKHGILDFFGQSPDSYEIMFFNASFRKMKPVWTLLSERGKKVCVLNVPLTYPPDKVNGIMISGMDTPDMTSDFIYPASFRKELDEQIGGYRLENPVRNLRQEAIEEQIATLFTGSQNRFDAAKYLLTKENWDLFVMVFEGTDRAQHAFWKYADPQHPDYNDQEAAKYGRVIADTYKDLDAKLGELRRLLPTDTTLIVVSDHGFGPLYTGVMIGKWLEDQGYLSGKTPEHSWKSLVMETASKVIPGAVKQQLKTVLGFQNAPKKTPLFFAHLDMEATRVYPIGGHGHLCINLKGRQPAGIVEPGQEYEELRDELIARIQELTDPVTGTGVIKRAYKREEVYSEYPETTPDIILTWAKGYYAVDPMTQAADAAQTAENELFTRHRWSGIHRPEGIVMAAGRPIKPHVQIEGAQIIDIAPTILSLLFEEIPDTMDGKVLTDLMTETFVKSLPVQYDRVQDNSLADSSPEQAFSEDESEKICDRLRKLGYL